ncbi:hypothetical protein ZIOFF_013873 [Zingiber officinale]|uniref:Amine oxidase domain-containing protein n=1 Tax=Zingiber officinale TaxID=94328 RepID=A0A8J5HSG1_ZINOF|nr:hypothetical protein ZIOFF_013873 [Zingiber officinale]
MLNTGVFFPSPFFPFANFCPAFFLSLSPKVFCRRIPPIYLLNPSLFSLFSQSLAHRSRAGAAAVHESIKDALTGKTSDMKSTNICILLLHINIYIYIYIDLNFLAASFYQKTEARQSHSPSAIVIGGGFAGIAAAHALKNAAFQVVLLESRDRIGGRVHTNYSFGFPVDMGAAWLHGVYNENPLASWIGRLGLPIYRTSGDNSVLYDHDLESYTLFDGDGH